MRVLIDTCVFIWLDSDQSKLSPAAQSFLETQKEPLILSMASLWELAIKISLGKLDVRRDLEMAVAEYVQSSAIRVLDIQIPHIAQLQKLPLHHKDPFDRLLISQAIVEDLSVVTPDAVFDGYPVRRIW